VLTAVRSIGNRPDGRAAHLDPVPGPCPAIAPRAVNLWRTPHSHFHFHPPPKNLESLEDLLSSEPAAVTSSDSKMTELHRPAANEQISVLFCCLGNICRTSPFSPSFRAL
jgi:hypothetical protein